jgi:hypothetical protein
MLLFLKFGVLLASLFAVVSLSVLVFRTFSFGKSFLHSEPRSKGRKGVFYVLGRGMMPWEKESARKHLPTYVGGMAYHTGIFAALAYLFSLVFSIEFSTTLVPVLRWGVAVGFLSGMALFLKRILLPVMRKISCPDDFAANLLVNIFLVFTFIRTYSESFTAFYYLAAIVMFLYIPVGKIRHCFFFFYAKMLFGNFYGRRGVLPSGTHKD